MIKNKYYRIYFKIIQKAKNEQRKKGKTYYEGHHVYPKSIYPKRKDDIVLLTAKEHFVCHLLLTKMFDEKEKTIAMNWALHRMSFSKNSKTKRYISSGEYELARKIFAKNISGEYHPSKTNPNWTENVKSSVKKSWKNDNKRRKLHSRSMKEKWDTDYEYMRNQARKNGLKGSKISADRRRGKPFPQSSMPGSKNPNAIHWTITEPNGNITECYGNIQEYCDSRGLSCDMMKRNGILELGYKGYKVIKNGKVKEALV
tara:strand:- start:182 stop:952 length:771 start_codon:yes stop_codon:yes gene_type:complete